MSCILAIDTSTDACSAALVLDGGLHERFEVIPRQHAARLLPMIQQLLAHNRTEFSQLDAVAFGRGPGSFTGLRIAAGVAQGLAFGLNVPVVPVSTLAALALQAARLHDRRFVLSCLDARIGEVYTGSFRVDGEEVEPLQDEVLCPPESMPLPPPTSAGESWFGAGSGWSYEARMPRSVLDRIQGFDAELLPRAGDIARLAGRILHEGGGVEPELAAPVYLRDKVTLK